MENIDIRNLVNELGKAELIIHAMLNAMTFEQKMVVTSQLKAAGIIEDGMTRANERRALLEKYGK